MNTLGALLGAAIASLDRHGAGARPAAFLHRAAISQPGLRPLFCLVLAVVASLAAPFVPTLHPASIASHLRFFAEHPFGTKPIATLAGNAIWTAGMSFAAVFELPALLHVRRARALVAGVISAAFVVVLEALQLFLLFQRPTAADAIANASGALAGAWIAHAVSRGAPAPAGAAGDAARRHPVTTLGFAILLPATRALAPFALKVWALPTWGEIMSFGGRSTLAHLLGLLRTLDLTLRFVPLGYVLTARGSSLLASWLYAVLLAGVIELIGPGIEGRAIAAGTALIATSGVLLGGWLQRKLAAR